MGSHHQILSGRASLTAETLGAGLAVVFLHAGVGDRRMWRAQMDAIGAADHQAIAYDRRGFGATRAEPEEFSSVSDLMAVIGALTDGDPVVLVGCSEGGRIAIDATLRHPTAVRALVLIAPSVGGAPEAAHPPAVKALLDAVKAAQQGGDLDRVNRIKAHLWLDGPLQPEGRVTGDARALFQDMNAIALRSPPIGSNLDTAPAFDRLGEIAAPTCVIWGTFDFPHIQARSRHIVSTVRNGSGHELAGTAHLPSLERPAETTTLLMQFLDAQRSTGSTIRL